MTLPVPPAPPSTRWLTAQEDPTNVPLLPWQAVFAEWLSSQAERPPVPQQRKMASSLAKQPISHRVLIKLKRNKAFLDYYHLMLQGATLKARAILEQHYTEGVETHLSGMRMALEAEDHKAIPSYTVPILDRVVPKKEAAPAATQVNVVLSTRQAALVESEAPEISYEVVEPTEAKP